MSADLTRAGGWEARQKSQQSRGAEIVPDLRAVGVEGAAGGAGAFEGAAEVALQPFYLLEAGSQQSPRSIEICVGGEAAFGAMGFADRHRLGGQPGGPDRVARLEGEAGRVEGRCEAGDHREAARVWATAWLKASAMGASASSASRAKAGSREAMARVSRVVT